MINYEKIASWHAKQRGGNLYNGKQGKIYYMDINDDYPSEVYDNYEDYVKSIWARNHKPYKWKK